MILRALCRVNNHESLRKGIYTRHDLGQTLKSKPRLVVYKTGLRSLHWCTSFRQLHGIYVWFWFMPWFFLFEGHIRHNLEFQILLYLWNGWWIHILLNFQRKKKFLTTSSPQLMNSHELCYSSSPQPACHNITSLYYKVLLFGRYTMTHVYMTKKIHCLYKSFPWTEKFTVFEIFVFGFVVKHCGNIELILFKVKLCVIETLQSLNSSIMPLLYCP